jgi:nucleosome assembly protein 1-like 1
LKLEDEYRKEWNQLKLKYLQSFQPLYKNRHNALIQSTDGKTGTPSLPDFWLTAMKNHVLLAEMIVAGDMPVLVSFF